MKRILILGFAILTLATLCACSVAIPDITNMEEAEALEALTSKGLVASVWYKESDLIESGNVIRTDPKAGTVVQKNSTVFVFVSSYPVVEDPVNTGLVNLASRNATVNWKNMATDGEDFWEFYAPYIKDGVLYIDCSVSFASDFEWLDDEDTGKLTGIASLEESLQNPVSISATYSSKQCVANERQRFELEIPLSKLGVQRPNKVYLNLYTKDNVAINVYFNIEW